MTRSIAAEIRASEAHYLAMAQACSDRSDRAGCAAALRCARHFAEEAARRELEDAEFDALLDGVLSEPSGVRKAPGLENVRALLDARRSA